MKSRPYCFGTNAIDSHNETVEKALDSIVENASRYRELMSSCDPHGLAFGRQLIERKQCGNQGQHVMFQITQSAPSKPLLYEMPNDTKQTPAITCNNGVAFPANTIFQLNEKQEQLLFKKPLLPPSIPPLAEYMPESKQKALFGSNQSALSNHTKAKRSVNFDVPEDTKLTEKRKFQEEVRAEFFATHKRLMVAESSNNDDNSAAKNLNGTFEQQYRQRETTPDFVVKEEFSLSAAVYSQRNVQPRHEAPNETQEIGEDSIDLSAFEEGFQKEAPVKNSMFWLYRRFPNSEVEITS